MVEATSNALLGVAGMSLDPFLGPFMSPRLVPVLITRCIHSPDQRLRAAKLVAAVLVVLHSGICAEEVSSSPLQPGIETTIAVPGCLHTIKAVVCRCWLMRDA